jgi:hypothetical protein
MHWALCNDEYGAKLEKDGAVWLTKSSRYATFDELLDIIVSAAHWIH